MSLNLHQASQSLFKSLHGFDLAKARIHLPANSNKWQKLLETVDTG